MRFDATLKRLFQQPPNRLLSYALEKPVAVARQLATDLITAENVHPDLLFEAEDGGLIHVELQSYSMPAFACRNLMYYALLLRDYKRPPVQVVFWVGKDPVGISGGLSYPPQLEYSYRIIDAQTIDAGVLLESGGIGESIFAILCKMANPEAIVAEIIAKISRLPKENQREAIAELLILSGLRDLTDVVREQVTHMPLVMDIHNNQFLRQVYDEGREAGHLETSREFLLKVAAQKFGPLSPAVQQRISQASASELSFWMDHFFNANSIESMLNGQ